MTLLPRQESVFSIPNFNIEFLKVKKKERKIYAFRIFQRYTGQRSIGLILASNIDNLFFQQF